MDHHKIWPLEECLARDLGKKSSCGKLSDAVRVDELADLSPSQANISTSHYNLSKPTAHSQCSGVLQPHSTLVVNRIPSTISTITGCTVSGVLFNLVQWVLSQSSITTSRLHIGVNLQSVTVVTVGAYVSLTNTKEKMNCTFNHIINSFNSRHVNALIKGSQLIELPLISWRSTIAVVWLYPY